MTDVRRPLVLISAGDDWLHDYWIKSLSTPLVAAGADVQSLSRFRSQTLRREVARKADGLLLGGGCDIDPLRYGAEMSSLLGPLDRERDEIELPLAREALELGIPLLGICRGMQVMSVCLGGTMYQDAAENRGAEDHPSGLSRGFMAAIRAELSDQPLPTLLTHPLTTTPGSLAAQLLGQESSVNSYHHQHLRDLPDGVEATSWAMDGVIEAIELPEAGGFAVGVQWELQASWRRGPELGFIERFVEAARAHAETSQEIDI